MIQLVSPDASLRVRRRKHGNALLLSTAMTDCLSGYGERWFGLPLLELIPALALSVAMSKDHPRPDSPRKKRKEQKKRGGQGNRSVKRTKEMFVGQTLHQVQGNHGVAQHTGAHQSRKLQTTVRPCRMLLRARAVSPARSLHAGRDSADARLLKLDGADATRRRGGCAVLHCVRAASAALGPAGLGRGAKKKQKTKQRIFCPQKGTGQLRSAWMRNSRGSSTGLCTK